ncbi:MAG: hypothetical protein WC307_00905 [Candidatus Nanoarchaeia archaeon]|jgi:hypothetical protein
MPLKNKTMALIRLRKIPYSGLLSFLQDVFYKDDVMAGKALKLLEMVYKKSIPASDWKSVVSELFNVKPASSSDESVIDDACINYLGFHREDVILSKARLRGRKAYKQLLERSDVKPDVKLILKKVSDWNSAVTSYYSIINKMKALGLIEKTDNFYVKSNKLSNRFSQVIGLLEGFELEFKPR